MNLSLFTISPLTWGLILEIVWEFQALEGRTAVALIHGKDRLESSKLDFGSWSCHLSSRLHQQSPGTSKLCISQRSSGPSTASAQVVGVSGDAKWIAQLGQEKLMLPRTGSGPFSRLPLVAE